MLSLIAVKQSFQLADFFFFEVQGMFKTCLFFRFPSSRPGTATEWGRYPCKGSTHTEITLPRSPVWAALSIAHLPAHAGAAVAIGIAGICAEIRATAAVRRLHHLITYRTMLGFVAIEHGFQFADFFFFDIHLLDVFTGSAYLHRGNRLTQPFVSVRVFLPENLTEWLHLSFILCKDKDLFAP